MEFIFLNAIHLPVFPALQIYYGYYNKNKAIPRPAGSKVLSEKTLRLEIGARVLVNKKKKKSFLQVANKTTTETYRGKINTLVM